MTNGTASETNGNNLALCPFCGGEARLVEDSGVAFGWCPMCNVKTRPSTDKRVAVERWNTRVAVTDHDFALAVHDGRTWVCVEAAIESDALKPIPGFTRDSIYRDSMAEYGEWMGKATELMRDIWTTTTWEYGMTDEHRDGLRRRLEEFGIEVER